MPYFHERLDDEDGDGEDDFEYDLDESPQSAQQIRVAAAGALLPYSHGQLASEDDEDEGRPTR